MLPTQVVVQATAPLWTAFEMHVVFDGRKEAAQDPDILAQMICQAADGANSQTMPTSAGLRR